ncbi:hypothetical protein Fmac_018418 [Flemingia macrophylla]|uniref:Uncharacterized protein n=1 Tax=Flemingia macrophylla TaxID=520843 RepID=A0ABD1M4X7_9FABA
MSHRIFGRISPKTWAVMEVFLGSITIEDYDSMTSLIEMGATSNDVDAETFARDLEKMRVLDGDQDLFVNNSDGPFRNDAILAIQILVVATVIFKKAINKEFVPHFKVDENYAEILIDKTILLIQLKKIKSLLFSTKKKDQATTTRVLPKRTLKVVRDINGDTFRSGGTWRSFSLGGFKHALVDLPGIELEGFNAVDGGRDGGGDGRGESLILHLAGDSGGFVGGESVVALGEERGCREGLD